LFKKKLKRSFKNFYVAPCCTANPEEVGICDKIELECERKELKSDNSKKKKKWKKKPIAKKNY